MPNRIMDVSWTRNYHLKKLTFSETDTVTVNPDADGLQIKEYVKSSSRRFIIQLSVCKKKLEQHEQTRQYHPQHPSAKKNYHVLNSFPYFN